MGEEYPYRPLRHDRSEIRLLNFCQTAGPDAVVELTVSRHSLDSSPSYLALSYVWGDRNLQRDIKLEGKCASISASLHSALVALRRYREERQVPAEHFRIWADAICINQSDNQERSQQIRLMGRLYREATHVVIWLDISRQNFDLAAKFIRAWTQTEPERIAKDWDGFLEKNHELFDANTTLAVNTFLTCSWWQRMWVYQEFVLASSASFFGEDGEVNASELKDANRAWDRLLDSPMTVKMSRQHRTQLVTLQTESARSLAVHRIFLHDKNTRSRFEVINFNMQSLQGYLHSREATDPRDKLYALLAVVSDEHKMFTIEPNYDNTVEEVYIDYAIKCVELDPSLDVLAKSGVGIPHTPPIMPLDLPSWAPDLRASCRWPVGIWNPFPRSTPAPKPRFSFSEDSRALNLDGVTCDIVTEAMLELDDAKSNWTAFIRSYKNVNPTGIPQIQAYMRTLLCRPCDSRHPNQFVNDLEREAFHDFMPGFIYLFGLMERDTLRASVEGRAKLERIETTLKDRPQHIRLLWLLIAAEDHVPLGSSDEELLTPITGIPGSSTYVPFPQHEGLDDYNDQFPYAARFIAAFSKNTRDRKLFVTSQGYMGLGPALMQADDRLCFIVGCKGPSILRKVTGGHYLHVGQCYVHGMMCGEIVDDIEVGKYQVQTFCLR